MMLSLGGLQVIFVKNEWTGLDYVGPLLHLNECVLSACLLSAYSSSGPLWVTIELLICLCLFCQKLALLFSLLLLSSFIHSTNLYQVPAVSGTLLNAVEAGVNEIVQNFLHLWSWHCDWGNIKKQDKYFKY